MYAMVYTNMELLLPDDNLLSLDINDTIDVLRLVQYKVFLLHLIIYVRDLQRLWETELVLVLEHSQITG